jgi:MipA family protein
MHDQDKAIVPSNSGHKPKRKINTLNKLVRTCCLECIGVKALRIHLALALLSLSAIPAHAQIDMRSADAKSAPNTWNVTLGVQFGAAPAFLGSKDFRPSIAPVFSIGRGLGSRWLSVSDDNIGIALVEGDFWRAGLTGKLLWGRNESSHAALKGLGDTRFGGELGGFAEIYPLSWLRARAELRHGVFAHDAMMGDLKLDAFTRLGDRWTLSAGPRLSFAGRDFVQTYLGVNAVQSLNSGLPQFKAADGSLSYGAAAQISYQWTPRLESTAFVQASRLAGDAAKSPIVTQRGTRDQLSLGVATRWTIDTGF